MLALLLALVFRWDHRVTPRTDEQKKESKNINNKNPYRITRASVRLYPLSQPICSETTGPIELKFGKHNM
jgi:hypothetical protein